MSRKVYLCAVLSILIIVGLCVLLSDCLSTGSLLNPRPEKLLKSTAILFRHGEKTPLVPLKQFQCAICDDIGFSQLTRNGSLQMFALGVYLRVKYKSLLPQDGQFRVREMGILSSASARATMSLQSFMAGFLILPRKFPETISNDSLTWQPFHYDMDYEGNRIHFRTDPKSCPRYFIEIEESLKNPPFSERLERDKEKIKSLRKLLITPIDSNYNLLIVTDSLDIYGQLAKETTPDWVSEMGHEFRDLMRVFAPHFNWNLEMQKFRSGLILTEIVDNFKMAIANEIPMKARKVLIYSGHDMNLFGMAYIFNVLDQIPEVSHADTIAFELIEDSIKEKWSVEMKFIRNRNEVYEEIPLRFCNGSTICPFVDFLELTHPFQTTRQELEDYCNR